MGDDGNGKRWMDFSSKAAWTLLAIVGVGASALIGVLWSDSRQNQVVNASQEVRIETINVKLDAIRTEQSNARVEQTNMGVRLEKMNDKLDETLRRLPR